MLLMRHGSGFWIRIFEIEEGGNGEDNPLDVPSHNQCFDAEFEPVLLLALGRIQSHIILFK